MPKEKYRPEAKRQAIALIFDSSKEQTKREVLERYEKRAR